MRIQVNAFCLHDNNLVKVIGVHGMDNPATMTFLIEWHTWDGTKDIRHTKEAQRHELHTAPTMECLFHDYRAALDAICAQANEIEALKDALEQASQKTDDIPF